MDTRRFFVECPKIKSILITHAAIEALDFYRNIVNNKDAVHPKSKDFGSVEAGMAFAEGEAAMAINWFGFASMCEVIEESKVKGKVDITELTISMKIIKQLL